MDNKVSISSIESEKEVLGAFLADNNELAKYVTVLTPKHFYNSNNQIIYKKMIEFYKKSRKFDLLLIQEELQGRVDYNVISEVAEYNGYAIESHVKNIIDCFRARELKKELNRSIGEINKENALEVINNLSNRFLELNFNTEKRTDESAEEIQFRVLDEIEEAYKKGNGQGYITGIKTGYTKFDYATNGFKRKQYYVIGARPSVGKSAFSFSVLDSMDDKYKTLYIQLDMTKESMIKRMLSMKTGIANRLLNRGKLSDNDWEKLARYGTPKKNLYIEDKANTTTNDIRNLVRKYKVQQGLDILIIDHLGKIKPTGKGSTYELTTKVSQELKEIAKEFDIVLIVLCQLSRAVEGRVNKRPLLSDLRDTGAIEQDADFIAMLYRDGYYQAREKGETITNDILEVSVQKNRDGLVGTIEFDFNLETQKIREKFN